MLLSSEVPITSVLFFLTKELSPVALIGLLLNKRQRIPYYGTLSRKYGFQLMVFDAENIHWPTATVTGLLLSRGQWYETRRALPAVIYNRCYPEDKQVIAQLETILGKGQVFNSTTLFDKWDVYKILHGFEKLQPILPNTKELVVDELPELLAQGTWVLKPRLGQSGRGLYQLKLQGDFVVISSGMNLPLPLPAGTGISGVAAVLTGGEPYIVQAYVPSAVYDGGLFDVRLVVQKDKHRAWVITGELSRLAEMGSFITNQFKAILHPREVLLSLGEKGRAAYKVMRRAALLSAEALDGPLGHLGELCVDFMVDEDGHPWLVEVNGKPDKGLFFELDDENMLEQVYLTPLMYAKSLSTKLPWGKGSRGSIREYMPKLIEGGPPWNPLN